MAINGISASSSASTNRASISQEDFLKVLLAQLQFQDPMKPMDNNQFIAQFAQMTSLEQTQEVNKKLDTVLTMQSSEMALGLLGHTVEATTNTGSQVGQVSSVAYTQSGPSLTLKTSQGQIVTGITLGQISTVQQ